LWNGVHILSGGRSVKSSKISRAPGRNGWRELLWLLGMVSFLLKILLREHIQFAKIHSAVQYVMDAFLYHIILLLKLFTK
jgi:hypothetical protein